MGVLGPNGAGKSTTIKLLLNLIRPTSGSARLFGLDPGDAEARRHVGYLPENPAPYEYLTGEEMTGHGYELGGASLGRSQLLGILTRRAIRATRRRLQGREAGSI